LTDHTIGITIPLVFEYQRYQHLLKEPVLLSAIHTRRTCIATALSTAVAAAAALTPGAAIAKTHHPSLAQLTHRQSSASGMSVAYRITIGDGPAIKTH
jgi:hypothetical protein